MVPGHNYPSYMPDMYHANNAQAPVPTPMVGSRPATAPWSHLAMHQHDFVMPANSTEDKVSVASQTHRSSSLMCGCHVYQKSWNHIASVGDPARIAAAKGVLHFCAHMLFELFLIFRRGINTGTFPLQMETSRHRREAAQTLETTSRVKRRRRGRTVREARTAAWGTRQDQASLSGSWPTYWAQTRHPCMADAEPHLLAPTGVVVMSTCLREARKARNLRMTMKITARKATINPKIRREWHSVRAVVDCTTSSNMLWLRCATGANNK